MNLKNKFNLAFKGDLRNDIEEDCFPTIQEMNEMLSETDKKHIRNIIGTYESGQIKKFGDQLNIIYNACYQLDSIILPTMDAEMIKSIYGEYEEEFTFILDTIDEIIKIANND